MRFSIASIVANTFLLARVLPKTTKAKVSQRDLQLRLDNLEYCEMPGRMLYSLMSILTCRAPVEPFEVMSLNAKPEDLQPKLVETPKSSAAEPHQRKAESPYLISLGTLLIGELTSKVSDSSQVNGSESSSPLRASSELQSISINELKRAPNGGSGTDTCSESSGSSGSSDCSRLPSNTLATRVSNPTRMEQDQSINDLLPTSPVKASNPLIAISPIVTGTRGSFTLESPPVETFVSPSAVAQATPTATHPFK